MSGFVDEAQLHVKAGDGGPARSPCGGRPTSTRGAPTGATAAGAATCGWWPPPTSRRCWPSGTIPTGGAGNGGHGGGKKKHGARGPDLEVPVPVGTRARRADGTVLADLVQAGDRWLAGEGGRGGRGNASFLTNQRRAPAFAEQGENGHEQWYDLELALVADVALVGFPNVGKSHPHLAHLGGQAEDRRLSVHHPRAPSGRGPRRRRRRTSPWPTSPGWWRARPRARASATDSSATSPGPGPGGAGRAGAGDRDHPRGAAPGAGRRAGPLPARAARPAPIGGGVQGRHGAWSARRDTAAKPFGGLPPGATG